MIPPPSREHSYVLLRRSTAYLCPPPSPLRFLSPENAHFLFDPASNACVVRPASKTLLVSVRRRYMKHAFTLRREGKE